MTVVKHSYSGSGAKSVVTLIFTLKLEQCRFSKHMQRHQTLSVLNNANGSKKA